MSLIDKIDLTRLPKHIALIMDGNGRWATERNLDRMMGHIQGSKSVRAIVEAATELGIKHLTLYTFSIENWARPQEEVHALMSLLVDHLKSEKELFMENAIRLRVIGDMAFLDENTRSNLDQVLALTENNRGMNLVLALSYSSRWEILKASKQIAKAYKDNLLDIDKLEEIDFTQYLETHFMPDPDLVIRTSGEYRISNFLLWQLAYAELYFSKLYWPDFGKEAFYEAIIDYQKRERRFGKTSKQSQQSI